MDLLNISQCPYRFYGIQLHQPTILELSEIFKQEEDLIFSLKMLIFSMKKFLNIEDENLSEFQIFLGLLVTDTSQMGLTIDKKENFIKLIQLCFKDYDLSIQSESFVFKRKEDVNQFIIIDNTNFNEFKNTLSLMFDIPEIFEEKNNQKYNPQSERAKRIAKTLEQSNKKIAELNGLKNKKGIIENYITILSIGLKIPPNILCKELTLYNLFNLYKRFTMKISWDLDIDCRLAGGSPKDSPENWMSLN